jgi:hypothetical protein
MESEVYVLEKDVAAYSKTSRLLFTPDRYKRN